MLKTIPIKFLIVCVLVVAACGNLPISTPVSIPPTLEPQQPTMTSALQTPAQPATVIATPEQTAVVLPTPGGASLPGIDQSVYLDDRSTPAALMLSYYNAINRREYLRAYSYYAPSDAAGTLEQFSNGYSDTQSVSVVIGSISSGAAAGSAYYTVPMVLNAVKTNSSQEKYAACYVLRFPQPRNYAAPPINPMQIDKGTARSIALTTTDADAFNSACPSPDYPTGINASPAAVESIIDLGPANYIDNRSDAVSLISSFLNSLNRKEYVRAYSYWQQPSVTLGPYDQFAAGYTNTATVTAQFGIVTSDPGAGQLYYSLPVAMRSTLTDNTQQTFVGCYVLHLAQPGFQAVPPFEPLGIRSATISMVDNNANIASLLATACQ